MSLIFFYFHIVKSLMPILDLLPMLCVCETLWLTVSSTGTGTETRTDIIQKLFTLAVSGTEPGHLKVI